MDPRKERILGALHAFIRQRAGLEFGNYGDVRAYRAEQRSITRDRHIAEKLLAAVARRSISADDLIAATRAYSGRLTITEEGDKVRVNYCAGHYFPTEYRRAVCAVAAAALWDWTRDKAMPEPVSSVDRMTGRDVDLYQGKTAGDWLRAHFRREFGASIARRFFD